ncbi:MAG: redoxin domain-containing protein [Gammaproteobacteria bacterium]|nr:redoxin domain-containing protein [Gammaproteobacteria bacterium]
MNQLFMMLMSIASMLPHQASANSDFGLLDQHGKFHQLSRYRDSNAVVVIPFSYHDPASVQIAEGLSAIGEQWEAQSVNVWLLNASDDPAFIRTQNTPDINFPVLVDSSQTVAKTLDVTVLGEMIVLDPGSATVMYRGINDVQQLAEVLTELIAANTARRPNRLQEPTQVLSGTALHYRFREQFAGRQISYQNEIAPLLLQRCAFCHVENGLAPWAMNRHLMVLGWSPMMRETVITRRMPPGQIDNAVGNWVNTHELSDYEMALLVEWIDQRAPKDGDMDPLAEPRPQLADWPMGEPDLIIDVPEQAIPATGNVDFLVKRTALNMPEDQWIRAVSYNVGDRSVLHSLLVYAVDKTLQTEDANELIAQTNADYISVYVPGETDDVFARDSGYLLQSGKDLVFKLRYLTSGRETVDRTQIGLYFHNNKPDMQLSTLALEKPDFVIPPNTNAHVETLTSQPLANDVWLESYSPHAHSRGKSMSLTVVYPGGSEEKLINVANFNYNWQLAYRPSEMKKIPAGSVFRAETVYDNSAANPFNPAPDTAAGQGYQFDSEMFSHFIRLAK